MLYVFPKISTSDALRPIIIRYLFSETANSSTHCVIENFHNSKTQSKYLISDETAKASWVTVGDTPLILAAKWLQEM